MFAETIEFSFIFKIRQRDPVIGKTEISNRSLINFILKYITDSQQSFPIDLAQYREMEVFTQFSSDLDEATKAQLAYGGCLMELLKQPLCNPLALHEQVITLWTATHKKMVHVDKKNVKQYQKDLLAYFDNVYPEIGKEIEETKVLSDELGEKILQVADEFRDRAATK